MKQTKPYGKAFDPAGIDTSGRPAQATITTPKAKDAVRKSGAQELMTRYAAANPLAEAPADPLRGLKRTASHLAIGVALLLAYVWIRDSTFAQNLISDVVTKETVMKCEDGKVQYQDWNLLDRLLDRGHFVCTQWKVQSRFLSSHPL